MRSLPLTHRDPWGTVEKAGGRMLDLFDTEVAFRRLSDARLYESYLVFKSLGYQPLVKFGTELITRSLSWGLPITPLVRHTIFRQFCGGVDAKSCMGLVKSMGRYGVGSILDYSVEAAQGEADFVAVHRETLTTIKLAGQNAKLLPMCVFKVTGLARLGLLEKKGRGEKCNAEEKAEWARVEDRVISLASAAEKAGIELLVDAEESWIQDLIDELARLAMMQVNRERVVVYNTLQMYRHDRLAFFKAEVEKAKTAGYRYGAKFVRGAYMEKERARAQEFGYPSPIQKNKSATDEAFDAAVEWAMDHLEDVAIFIGTHNEVSTQKATKLMADKGLKTEDPRVLFSQLYGMSDHLSFNLGAAGYRVAKYLPYGPVKSVLPYLFRRAEENSSIQGQAGRELKLLSQELKRRRSVVS